MTGPQIAREVTRVKRLSKLTDRAVLGRLVQPCDAHAEWVNGSNNYVWWFLLAEYLRPRRVLEIGTRFGYSAWAVVNGANHPPSEVELIVYDAEVDDDKEPLKVFESWFTKQGVTDLDIYRQDTQKLPELNPGVMVDWVTIDANHSEAGALHDCRLAWPWIKRGGVMVIDDTNPGEVQRAAERFAAEVGVEWGFLPTLRGVHVLVKS